MDDAFLSFRQIIGAMLALGDELVDEEAGVRSRIYEYGIDSPVELDISRDETGALRIGSTPPLYYVDTTFRPSFHRLTFTAEISRNGYGD